jgi:hypothetical protein
VEILNVLKTLGKRRLTVAVAAAIVLLAAMPGSSRAADDVTPSALKAAFLFNFAKFTDWTGAPSAGPIVLCVANDDQIETALADSVRGQSINGRGVEVRRVKSDNALPPCHLLFVPGSEARQMLARIGREASLLTVSDGTGFAQSGGMIELFQDSGRMRFAINVDTAQRSRVRLSSRLLDLAKIVRTQHGQ